MSEQEEPKIKPVIWKWDYGVYVPFCPYCGEPAYEKDRCFSCGKPYEWTDGEIEPTTVSRGEYTAIQATNNHIYNQSLVKEPKQTDDIETVIAE